jgi:hypothetical protein
MLKFQPSFGSSPAHEYMEIGPFEIAAHESLWKQDQFRALALCLLGQYGHFFHGRTGVVGYRRILNDGNSMCGHMSLDKNNEDVVV